MNVFVLCTGRSGSVTFSKACGHLTNYSAGHETRSGRLGEERFGYPQGHIEVDNRLAWHLGALGARWDGREVLYVHLLRDRDAVARSFMNRWDGAYRASIIRAFAHGILTRTQDWPEDRHIDVANHYVDTVTSNIQDFLRGRPHMTINVETIESDFPRFLDRIGAEGDLNGAMAEWAVRHNPSVAPPDSA
ncbi:hypothetical protein [Nocardioides insulae]|uniref:hypothetical protein n=1 Tax=Nocardioides insulae TaxID=394734 RepID=UPI000560BDE8|nr:hypothetical protein [Nocardioides insulae]